MMETSDKLYVTIGGRRISSDDPPYVIAEVSANHDGSLERAMQIVTAASEAGADAVKLQTYTPDTLTIDCDAPDFRIRTGLWAGRTLHDLYGEACLPWEWHEPLFAHARRLGIQIFSTPFDATAIDLLERLDTPAYKIASFELTDIPLVERVAACGKPMIMSTGMANAEEIAASVAAAREAGCRELVLLHCISSYPAAASDYNLRTLVDMRERFGVLVGLSDHTIDTTTAQAAVSLGACVVEKHVTLDRDGGGPDDSFSLEPAELATLCRGVRNVWESLGRVNYDRAEAEMPNLVFRRSLYVVEDIASGERLGEHNVRSIRPGFGMSPDLLPTVIGARACKTLKRGTSLQKGMFAHAGCSG